MVHASSPLEEFLSWSSAGAVVRVAGWLSRQACRWQGVQVPGTHGPARRLRLHAYMVGAAEVHVKT
jgi:hypothetical protein